MKKIAYIIALTFGFVACQDVVDLELPDGTKAIVIYGRITDKAGLQELIVSETANYFDNSKQPMVSGAICSIIERNQQGVETAIWPLTEDPSNPGHYFTDSAGKAFYSYKVRVEALGDTYESNWEVLRPTTRILKIESTFSPSRFDTITGNDYVCQVYSYDRPGLGDNFRWRYAINGEWQSSPFDIAVAFDAFFDGMPFPGVPFTDNDVYIGDTVLVEQMGISSDYLNFMTKVQQTGFVGSPFDPPPSPIEGNLRNITNSDPAKKPLGYFYAAGISRAAVVVDADSGKVILLEVNAQNITAEEKAYADQMGIKF